MNITDKLRRTDLRTKPIPLSSLQPLLHEAADEIDFLVRLLWEWNTLGYVKHLSEETDNLLKRYFPDADLPDAGEL